MLGSPDFSWSDRVSIRVVAGGGPWRLQPCFRLISPPRSSMSGVARLPGPSPRLAPPSGNTGHRGHVARAEQAPTSSPCSEHTARVRSSSGRPRGPPTGPVRGPPPARLLALWRQQAPVWALRQGRPVWSPPPLAPPGRVRPTGSRCLGRPCVEGSSPEPWGHGVDLILLDCAQGVGCTSSGSVE